MSKLNWDKCRQDKMSKKARGLSHESKMKSKASEKQKSLMRKLGIEFSSNISNNAASGLIGYYLERKRKVTIRP